MPVIWMAHRQIREASGHETGRQLLRELYSAHVGGEMPPVLLGDRGKPYWENSPWHFSISHTPRHAFCVLSDVPVGVDAEEADRQVDLRIAPKILSPGELTRFAAAEDPHRALLTLWVLKEAQGKLTGEGITFHPRHTDFDPADPRVQQIDGCLVAVIHEQVAGLRPKEEEDVI